MNVISKMINLASITTGVDYELELTKDDLELVRNHMDLCELSDLEIKYTFSENNIFHKTYDVSITISANYRIISGENNECSETMLSSDTFVTTLLDKNITNISKDVMRDMDIELISNNQFDIADLAIQHLSLMLYM